MGEKTRKFVFGGHAIDFGERPLVMGIVNATPDSFSDGGRFHSIGQAAEFALSLIAQGADIIDIGGESTRPGHEDVPADVEIRRVVPLIEAVRAETDVPISVDTMKAEVAEAAFDAGAAILNDTTACERDFERKAELLARTGGGAVLMHWHRRPADLPDSGYVRWVAESLVADAIRIQQRSGLPADHFMIDPGIGFDKSDSENLALIGGIPVLHATGYPVLLGVSRKSFIGRLLGEDDPSRRTWGTAGAVSVGAWLGAEILRVHDVQEMSQALRIVGAIRQSTVFGK